MTYHKDLLKNSQVFSRFEHLQEQGKNPQLAIYRGRRLVIISFDAKGCLEKISQVFKKILYSILKCFKALKINEAKIQNLKEKVYFYHYQQVHRHKQAELQHLEEHHELIYDQGKLQLEELTNKNNAAAEETIRLKEEIDQLKEQNLQTLQAKTKLDQSLKNIQAEYLQAQQIVSQKNAAKDELQELNKAKNLLLKENKELEKTKERLAPAKKEMERIKQETNQRRKELAQVNADLAQKDYKSKFSSLESEHYQLQQKQRDTENEKNQWFTVACAGHAFPH
jgi:chromosome segregation ATPase